MNRRQRRAFMRQFETQIAEERNGAPPPPEIAARMTKPKPVEILWQVVVTRRRDGGHQAVGPAISQAVAEEFAATINAQVALGKEKLWANALAVPLTPIGGLH